MVHAAAVLGLAVDGVEVTHPGAVAKTLPDFRERWAAMLTGVPARPRGVAH
jgi:3-phosphoshikimate 1-carboxyvinyltransferase